MTRDDPPAQDPAASGEIVSTTVPDPSPDVVDVPASDPVNETPTDQAMRLRQAQTGGIIPDNEDG